MALTNPPPPRKPLANLVADTEWHLWDLDVNEGVVHGSPLLHLVNVIHWVLEEKDAVGHWLGHWSMGSIPACSVTTYLTQTHFLDFGDSFTKQIPFSSASLGSYSSELLSPCCSVSQALSHGYSLLMFSEKFPVSCY